MFARVSTYQLGPGTTGQPTQETIDKVFALPGCRGIYYLKGSENKSLSITLWANKEALTASEQPANDIRLATSAEQNMQVLSVEAFEVLTEQRKD